MRRLLCVIAVLITGTGLALLGLASPAAASAGWIWSETNYNASSGATSFGWAVTPDCLPITGDWQGTGATHVGLACYSSSSGWTWHTDTGGGSGGSVTFGWGGASDTPSSCQPITGDWFGTGSSYVGLACYSSSSGWTWHEDTGANSGGGAVTFGWGGAGDGPPSCSPITGDWFGRGASYVGLSCWTSSGWTWHENTGANVTGGAAVFGWGGASDTRPACSPITGDWANYAGGVDHVGLSCWSSSGWSWHEDTGSQGGGAIAFGWGGGSDTRPNVIPITGDWNADKTTTVGLVNSGGLVLGSGQGCNADNSCPPLTFAEIEGFWVAAGGPSSVAGTAAAITGAEAGFAPGAIQQGVSYCGAGSDKTGWGLWQITCGNSVSTFGVDYQMLDPWNNAEAAVAKYEAAGNSFTPWTTYTSGAYRSYLPSPVPAPQIVADPGQYAPRGSAPAGLPSGPQEVSQPGAMYGPAMP